MAAPDASATPPPHAPAERILSSLKTRGALGIPELAGLLGVSVEAVRQQIARLAADGLVQAERLTQGRGRPAQLWRLSAAGHARFPDTHAEMTVQMIQAVVRVFGAEGMDRLIGAREDAMRESYRAALRGARSLPQRLARLAEMRSREGYMAEYQPTPGGYLFIENHCPVCTAARACSGLCRSELQLLGDVLGGDVAVERVEHVLAGARRCAYRVTRRSAKARAAPRPGEDAA